MPALAPRLVYLSPGLFDFGGIARYGRYQVRALRAAAQGAVRAASLHAPTVESTFADPVAVDFVGGGVASRSKFAYALRAATWMRPGGVAWCGHLHLAPLGHALAMAAGGRCVVNVYGLEVWSSARRAALAALGRAEVISDCHATAQHLIDNGIVRPERVRVIWDPVDARFAPGRPDDAVAAKYGIAPSGFRVMFLGRLASGAVHKGPDALIRAFAQARLPADAQLVIAGSGDRRAALEALAAASGCADRIVFTGRVEDADLPAMYRLASLFVLVSRKYAGGGEGLPLTPIEAAACGVPIVVGDEDGSREAVRDGETGFLVRSRDDAALARALEDAAVDPARLKALGEAAARDAALRFSYARFEREHRDFLLSIGASREAHA